MMLRTPIPSTTPVRGAAPSTAHGTTLRSFARRLLALVVGLLVAAASSAVLAQDLDADAVLDNVQARASALQDASFLLTGAVYDPDGTEIALEIDVQIVPDARAASAYIVQPDALADNTIVLDGDAVYNYVYLTNQVTIFDASDPDALGGLVGDASFETDLATRSLDVRSLLAGFAPVDTSYVDTPAGAAYRIRFENPDEGALVTSVVADVLDGEWIPYRLEFLQGDGTTLARLVFENVALDTGLDPADVTYVPEDAEVFDERN